jgi:hypothetical protein
MPPSLDNENDGGEGTNTLLERQQKEEGFEDSGE